jgi:glutathione S-transferase
MAGDTDFPALIGQYDSPFVRRVAVAMRLHGLEYRHLPWSTFGDADRLAEYTPLMRVPVLLLQDGPPLIESEAILEHVDMLAGRKLIPEVDLARRRARYIAALATGLADKAVALVYERVLHDAPSPVWMSRCERQIRATLDVLEAESAARSTLFWFGTTPGHADIAVACALRFVAEAHPGNGVAAGWPSLVEHAASCEALDAFRAVTQPFAPPS